MVRSFSVALGALLVLSGCAATPSGPHVLVMPGANKPFEYFQQDQALCKHYASEQVSGQAESANERAIGGALIGGALGAGLGAAIGGGSGAAIGAAGGVVAGTAVGAGTSHQSQGGLQRQYDNAYLQCMSARGNQMPQQPQPVVVTPAPTVVYPAPPPPAYYAPPPPVYYAPPPVVYYPAPR